MKIPSTLDFVKNLQAQIRESDFHSFDEAQAQNLLSEHYCVEIISALEKHIPKKPIEKEMPYSEEVGLNSEWHCPSCGEYVGHFSEGMNEPEQMEYCCCCGQHIARDWSDEE